MKAPPQDGLIQVSLENLKESQQSANQNGHEDQVSQQTVFRPQRQPILGQQQANQENCCAVGDQHPTAMHPLLPMFKMAGKRFFDQLVDA